MSRGSFCLKKVKVKWPNWLRTKAEWSTWNFPEERARLQEENGGDVGERRRSSAQLCGDSNPTNHFFSFLSRFTGFILLIPFFDPNTSRRAQPSLAVNLDSCNVHVLQLGIRVIIFRNSVDNSWFGFIHVFVYVVSMCVSSVSAWKTQLYELSC